MSKSPLYSLHIAAWKGLVGVARLLLANGAPVDAKTQFHHGTYRAVGGDWTISQQSALHLASKKGHLEVTKLLMANGADVNASDELQRIPLLIASENGHHELARLLLASGADVNAIDKDQ